MTIVTGDFNSKVGRKPENHNTYHEICGIYGKGKTNNNGIHLMNFSKTYRLMISNTFFKHKISQRTTWISPNGKQKNQIDFILVKKSRGIQIKNSRSYGGLTTSSDHKMVMMSCTFKWPYTKSNKNQPKINIENLRNDQTNETFREKVKVKLDESTIDNPQESWNEIVSTLISTSKEVLGMTKKHQINNNNDEIIELSKQQKNLRLQINNNPNHHLNDSLRIKRNAILTKIHNLIKAKKNEQIDKQLEEIEKCKDDSTRMFSAIKKLQRMKPKQQLLINTKEGKLTAIEKEQANIIADHFHTQFFKEGKTTILIEPTPMRIPFTDEEVKKVN